MRRTKFLGAFALLMMLVGLVPMGCGSNTVGPVRVIETGRTNRSNYPDRTVERFQECVTEHAAQLGPGNHALDATMDMDEDGLRYNVEIANLPASGEDFGGCMRSALEDMVISEKLLDNAREKLKAQREEQQKAQKELLGSPVVIVVAGVTVIVTEVMLEAGAITILFATTVTLIDKAATDVAELISQRKRNECTAHYVSCVGSALYRNLGRGAGDSRCGGCAYVCHRTGKWPSAIGAGTCDYDNGTN